MQSSDPRLVPYCGAAPDPGAWLGSWNTDPVLWAGLGLALLLGLRGTKRRGLFLLAWFGLVLAFVSPLCAMTTALFAARALHHLVLLSLVAPLLAVSLPLRGLALPIGFALTALVLVLWHLPPVYSAAWGHDGVYWLLQLALLLPAWAFWTAIFAADARATPAVFLQALLLGAMAGVMGMIGAVLTFSRHVLYLEHLSGSLAWGISPLQDQQLAGLVMWVPGLLPLAVIAACLARRGWKQAVAA